MMLKTISHFTATMIQKIFALAAGLWHDRCMRHYRPVTAFTIALVGLLFGASLIYGQSKAVSERVARQQSGSNTFSVSDATTIITSSGQLSSGTVLGSGTGNSWIVSSTSGVPAETRELKGPGPTLKLLKDTSKRLSAKDSAPDGYIQLARLVGARVPAAEAAMVDAIRELGLPLYDWDKVDQFLARKARQQGANTRWVWKPISDVGVKQVSELSWTERDRAGVGFVFPKIYGNKIPMPTLAIARAVIEKIPETLVLISDYEVINPDPFMAVTTPELLANGKLYIVDVWDEPSFGVAIPAKLSH